MNSKKLWFTSDTHFGHTNIRKFCPVSRGMFASVTEMDEAIIHKHNELVAPNDDVWFLGDCGFSKPERVVSNFLRLNGNKHLIIGNHDSKLIQVKEFFDLFDSVQYYHQLCVDKMTFHLFHYPIYEWKNMNRGDYHLHGHVHGGKVPIAGRIMDVGLDCVHDDGEYLKPFSLDEVVRRLGKIDPRPRTH